jgi:hypothetical protein
MGDRGAQDAAQWIAFEHGHQLLAVYEKALALRQTQPTGVAVLST